MLTYTIARLWVVLQHLAGGIEQKFKQIFSILLHRDHRTYSHTYRTTQLHPVGEVRSLVRKQVPSETLFQRTFILRRSRRGVTFIKINELLGYGKMKKKLYLMQGILE